MSTANDIVTGGLRCINAYATGQPLDPGDAQEALGLLNELLETLDIEHISVFSAIERIVSWTSGQYIYTVGAPALGTSGASLIVNLTSGLPTFTLPGAVPPNMTPGATLIDYAGAIPTSPPTTISQIVGTTVTMSANASANANADQITYSGQFNFALPTRITNGYSRISNMANLDYPFEMLTQQQYSDIGIKNLPGPWPTGVYYNRQYPIGFLYVWKVPQNNAEAHLWCDYNITRFATLSDTLIAPEGYSRMLKYNLALDLAPRYGRPITPDLLRAANTSKAAIKALNINPPPQSTFDSAISGSQRKHDAGWVLHGGFR
jgi:hypothetical protein